MQLQKAFLKQYLQHAKPWATLNKQQKTLDDFAMSDYFGLNSLFMSTTPDDECTFRVRLYCKPHYWVSSSGLFQIGIVCSFCNFIITTYSKVEYSVTFKVEICFCLSSLTFIMEKLSNNTHLINFSPRGPSQLMCLSTDRHVIP